MMFWSFVQIFVFCNCGERINGGFEELSDTLYECDWYTASMGIQQMIPTVMIATQQKVLRGSGNIPCTREAFMEVSIFAQKFEIL